MIKCTTIQGQKYQVKICDKWWQQTIGLMGQRKVKPALLFKFKKVQDVRLHMFFVFCSICAVYLDERYRVIAVEKLHPFRIGKKYRCQYVLEIDVSAHNNIRVGDRIVFE